MTDSFDTRYFDRRATALPGQWLYLVEGGGVVYSEITNRFAGLDAGGVYAYLAFDDGASVQDLRQFDRETSSPASIDGLETIYALTQGRFPGEEHEQEWPVLDDTSLPDLRTHTGTSRRKTIDIAGIPALLEFPAGELESLCEDYFQNCPPATQPPHCYISARYGDKGWAVHVNGREFLRLKSPDQLGLGLMHAARAIIYAEGAYDVALHAAAVAHLNSAVLLCAPRESGKSTLTAYLVAHGFDLLSDEPAFLQLDIGAVSGFSHPISLKEGSWRPLKDELSQFSLGPIHMRSDGTRIRLAHAPSERRATGARKLTHIVFPQYEPSANAQIEALSPLQALALLNEGGLLLANGIGRDGFERFLSLLVRTPAHRISYDTLDAAWRLLGEASCNLP